MSYEDISVFILFCSSALNRSPLQIVFQFLSSLLTRVEGASDGLVEFLVTLVRVKHDLQL